MALPTFVDATSFQSGTAAADIVIPAPTGIQDGDLMLAMVCASTITGTFSTVPSGWTLLTSLAPATTCTMFIYYKVAASESGDYTWVSNPASRKLSGTIVVYRGADSAPHTYSITAGTSSTSVVAAQVTTTVSDCALVFLSTMIETTGNAQSGTVPSGMTEREDNNPTQAGDRTGAYAATEDFATAGATGTRTMTQATASVWVAALVAIRSQTSVAASGSGGGRGRFPRHRLRARWRGVGRGGAAAADPAGGTAVADYEWWPGVAPNDYADSAALLADNGGANDFAGDDKNYLVPTTSGSTENAAARTEWAANGQVTLDTGVGLSPSTKSMKYLWPADCGKDCEIRRNIQLPVRQAELWAEFVVRFSSGWTADGPETGNIDYKFIFGRLDSDRFILKVFTGGGNQFNFGQPPGGEDNFSAAMGSSIADGADHTIRLHFKRSTTATSADGGIKLIVDGVDKGGSLGVNTTVGGVLCSTIYGLALGANINQGVGATPQTLHWLRVRVWYEGNDPGWGI